MQLTLVTVEHTITCEGFKYLLLLGLAEITEQLEVTGRVPIAKVNRLVAMFHLQELLLDALHE